DSGLPALPSLVRPRPGQDAAAVGWTTLLEALGRLWRDGAPVDWTSHLAGANAQPTEAPDYPFQRQRFWLSDPTLDRAATDRASTGRAVAVSGARGDQEQTGSHTAALTAGGSMRSAGGASAPSDSRPSGTRVGDARVTDFYDELAAAAGHDD